MILEYGWYYIAKFEGQLLKMYSIFISYNRGEHVMVMWSV